MLTHIVFFKLKQKDTESVEKAKNTLKSMEGKIAVLKSIQVGVNVVYSARAYDIALVTTFDSLEDMEAYQIHPVHANEVQAVMKPNIEATASVDFIS